MTNAECSSSSTESIEETGTPEKSSRYREVSSSSQESIDEKRMQMRKAETDMDVAVEKQRQRLITFSPSALVYVMMTITATTTMVSQKVLPDDVIRCMAFKYFKDNSGLEVREVKQSKRMRKQRQSFYNSVSLQCRLTNNRNVVCKLFCNGNLHCAGCQSIDDFFVVTGRVCKVLTAISGSTVSLTGYKISLINKQFNCGRHLELKDLAQALRQRVGNELSCVSFEPPFPGINAKFLLGDPSQPDYGKKKASIMAYRR